MHVTHCLYTSLQPHNSILDQETQNCQYTNNTDLQDRQPAGSYRFEPSAKSPPVKGP